MTKTGVENLFISFHGRIIDHLGIQMYHSPVAALAELVSNSWDADATEVEITLPDSICDDSEIVISDDGDGMTIEECEKKYLNIGYCKRQDNPNQETSKGRPVLGRKGIGKFAGFGIAEVIRIETISGETGEKTTFELDINDLRSTTYVHTTRKSIPVIEYLEPDEERKGDKGTKVTLKKLKLSRTPSKEGFGKSMSRRFLLHKRAEDFEITVNGEPIPEDEELVNVEYSFPRDYEDAEIPEGLEIVDDWGIETVGEDEKKEILWRFVFYKDTIPIEYLRGITVFAKGKLAQTPFLFNLKPSHGGQFGESYLSGQVEADYIDSLEEDLIATERQRINWELEATRPLEEWGQTRLKQIFEIWKERRAEKRKREIEEKISAFSERLERLQRHEGRTVKTALIKIGSITSLNTDQFNELCGAVLTAWEKGRLRDLISDVSQMEDIEIGKLMELLFEASVLTALNTAEAVRTKLETIGGLKLRIKNRELENAVRDYIAENPWLISPKWQTFQKERSVKKLMDDLAVEQKMNEGDWEGRIDLALSSGEHLLILEFMRPGLTIDRDHIDRFDWYVRKIDGSVQVNTGSVLKKVSGYIVADKLNKSREVLNRLDSLEKERKYAIDWDTLLGESLNQWIEFLHMIIETAPDDTRLQALLEGYER